MIASGSDKKKMREVRIDNTPRIRLAIESPLPFDCAGTAYAPGGCDAVGAGLMVGIGAGIVAGCGIVAGAGACAVNSGAGAGAGCGGDVPTFINLAPQLPQNSDP